MTLGCVKLTIETNQDNVVVQFSPLGVIQPFHLHSGVKNMLVSAACLITHNNSHASVPGGAAMYSLVLQLFSGYLCTHTLPLHTVSYHKEENSHAGVLHLVIPPPHGSASVTCPTKHSKAHVTTAVVGKHTTRYHSGGNSHVRIAPANAAPPDLSAPVTCFTTTTRATVIPPPKLIFGFHAPYWGTNLSHSLS